MRRTALLLSCLLLTACGQGAAPVASQDGALVGTVPQDGDTVTGAGRVVQVAGGPVLFCGYEWRADVGYAPGAEPARRRILPRGASASTDCRPVRPECHLAAAGRVGALLHSSNNSHCPLLPVPCPRRDGVTRILVAAGRDSVTRRRERLSTFTGQLRPR